VFACAAGACASVLPAPASLQASGVHSLRWWADIAGTLFVGAAGLHNLAIYFMRRKDRAPLFFGLFCIVVSFNNLVYDKVVAGMVVAHGWAGADTLHKIDLMTIVMTTPCVVLFLHAFFPGTGSPLAPRIFLALLLAVEIALLCTSGPAMETVFRWYLPVFVVGIVYSLVLVRQAVRARREYARWILAGCALLSVAGINDVAWAMGYLHAGVWLPTATFAFALIDTALISRRFARALWDAERLVVELLENQRLREEMHRHLARERDLHRAQSRLAALLHSIEVPLCAQDETGAMVFCNRAFEHLCGKTLSDMSGQKLEPIVNNVAGPYETTTVPIDLDDERLSIVILTPPTPGESVGNRPAAVVTSALERSRTRARVVGMLADAVAAERIAQQPDARKRMDMIDNALAQISRLLGADTSSEQRARLAVDALNMAIQYWSESTGKDKFDLAQESGLWKVHTNPDGWPRTQTLDRYLDVRTFPKNPRWRRVTDTLDFVLVRCHTESSLRKQLEQLLQSLQMQLAFD